jgi:hypothetical protein
LRLGLDRVVNRLGGARFLGPEGVKSGNREPEPLTAARTIELLAGVGETISLFVTGSSGTANPMFDFFFKMYGDGLDVAVLRAEPLVGVSLGKLLALDGALCTPFCVGRKGDEDPRLFTRGILRKSL